MAPVSEPSENDDGVEQEEPDCRLLFVVAVLIPASTWTLEEGAEVGEKGDFSWTKEDENRGIFGIPDQLRPKTYNRRAKV